MAFSQTCDQSITGRNFQYSRALQVIQSEEYLDDVDFDIIRRSDTNYAEDLKVARVQSHLEDFDPDSLLVGRSKRQTSLFGNYALTSSTNFTSATDLIWCTIAMVGVLGGLALAAPPPPTIQPGDAPPGNPQPGEPGGGGSPGDFTNPSAAEAIALVPAGLTPVAVFPPFATPRTVPAVAVIFSEDPATVRRRKREIDRKHGRRRPYSSGGNVGIPLFQRLWKNIRCIRPRLARMFARPRPQTSDLGYYHYPGYYNRRSYFDDIRNRIRKRDTTHYYSPYGGYVSHYVEDYTVDSADDCFDDIDEPLYGWRVRVTLKENEPCVLNSTCIVSTSNSFATNFPTERQTGESFTSAAPPDCRLNFG